MTLEGCGEVFKGDSADMCAGKFSLAFTGGRANGQACADGERGPPSVGAEIETMFCICIVASGFLLSTIYYNLSAALYEKI
jgi:hypothetical protein